MFMNDSLAASSFGTVTIPSRLILILGPKYEYQTACYSNNPPHKLAGYAYKHLAKNHLNNFKLT